MVTRLKIVKTTVDDDTLAFRDIVHNIITHPGSDQANALADLKRSYHQEVASELDKAVRSGGIEDMWRVWDTLEKHNKWMKPLRNAVKVAPELTAPGQAAALKYAGTLLSDVKPEKVRWLWKQRLALGKLTILDGDPGLGKSLIGADLAARITSPTKCMPDGSPCLERGGMVIIMPEDGLADTVQPRFARAGADLAKISSIGTINFFDEEGQPCERPFDISRDLPLLEAEIERVDAKIVYIDPILALLGGDTYKDTNVRLMLAPLKMLVEKCNVACILVRHLTKSRGENPLFAGSGSIAFVALCRTTLMVIKDPEDESRVILSHIKSNIGKLGPGITYTIQSDEDDGDDRPYIVWGEVTSLTGADLMSTPRKNTSENRQQILNYIRSRAGEELTVAEIAAALPEISASLLGVTLSRMVQSNEVGKTRRGVYHAV